MHTLKLQIHEKAFAKVLKFLESFDQRDLSIVENDFVPTNIENHMKQKGQIKDSSADVIEIDDFEIGLESIIKQYENEQ